MQLLKALPESFIDDGLQSRFSGLPNPKQNGGQIVVNTQCCSHK
jgi:hypothetical protein